MMSDKGKHLIPEERNLEDRAYDLFGELLLERHGAALREAWHGVGKTGNRDCRNHDSRNTKSRPRSRVPAFGEAARLSTGAGAW